MEDCTYKGEAVLTETSVTDSHSCQELLETIGFAYHAVYFTYSSKSHTCTFYDSDDMDCASLSGPVLPKYDTCIEGPSSTAAPTTATTAGPTTATTAGPTTITSAGPTTVTTAGPTTVTTAGPTTVTTAGPTTVTTAGPTTTTSS
eukprot:TRINITY_DN783_c1_g1_i17.p2 TRINITY_DN783_c1_g1~~TRINITY_DN783_c1_g1_i17.p2  ORF type:complete len:145 (+),score=18.77 TRINITY_DN783_c1_g1_i17:2-436(+)